ncbi:MAG: hypothetical protein ACKESB_00590 [Candidatus Hodgkinia cicadicola]
MTTRGFVGVTKTALKSDVTVSVHIVELHRAKLWKGRAMSRDSKSMWLIELVVQF